MVVVIILLFTWDNSIAGADTLRDALSSHNFSGFPKFWMLKEIILSCTPEHSNTAIKVKIAASITFGVIPISTIQ